MAQILFITDIHIKPGNLQDIDLFIDRLETRILQQRRLDSIVIGGDTLDSHERIHMFCLNKMFKLVDMLQKYTEILYILVGNHERSNPAVFLGENHSLHAFKDRPGIIVVDSPVYSGILNTLLVPYVPNGRFLEAIQTVENMEEKQCVIFAHQEFRGCTLGAIVSDHGDEYPENSPPVITGHIHSNQQPQPNIYYPGSSLQHAFGESTKNVVAIVSIPEAVEIAAIAVDTPPESGQVFVEEIDLELPRKITLYCDAEMFEETSRLIPEDASHTRLVVEGTADEFKALRKKKLFKTLKSRGAKVVFKSRVLELAETEEQKTTEDFISVLQELCNDTPQLRNLCDEVLQQTLQEQ